MAGSSLVLATRQSPLALAQAELAAAHYAAAFPERACALLRLTTTGDRRRDWSLEKQGGKGLFTVELEQALLDGRACAAVHSAKDLPTEVGPGLTLAGFLPREDPRDVLVLREGVELPALIATGSPRRRLQARRMFPDCAFTELRGNVDTRLRKVAEGQADGTFLAAAGLNRLGIATWPGLTFRRLELAQMVPAVGQAAIAIQCREADAGQLGAGLHAATGLAVRLEREVLCAVGGGCQVSFAAHVSAEGVLWIFHERCGAWSRPLSTWPDLEQGRGEVAAVLRELGLVS